MVFHTVLFFKRKPHQAVHKHSRNTMPILSNSCSSCCIPAAAAATKVSLFPCEIPPRFNGCLPTLLSCLVLISAFPSATIFPQPKQRSHRCMARGGHWLANVSPGSAMSYPSAPSSLRPAPYSLFKGSPLAVLAAVFYPLSHPTPYVYERRCKILQHVMKPMPTRGTVVWNEAFSDKIKRCKYQYINKLEFFPEWLSTVCLAGHDHL
jgi:hypothetical protein